MMPATIATLNYPGTIAYLVPGGWGLAGFALMLALKLGILLAYAKGAVSRPRLLWHHIAASIPANLLAVLLSCFVTLRRDQLVSLTVVFVLSFTISLSADYLILAKRLPAYSRGHLLRGLCIGNFSGYSVWWCVAAGSWLGWKEITGSLGFL